MKTSMSTIITHSYRSRSGFPSAIQTVGACLIAALFLICHAAQGGSATWNAEPATNDWNTAANWSPATVPSEMSDVATLAQSHVTNISISATIDIAGVVFTPGASAYKISGPVGFFGAGVTNDSGVTQNFDLTQGGGFLGQATAGDGVTYTINGSTGLYDFTTFFDTSSAGSATFIINGAPPDGGYGGDLGFADDASAAESTIILSGPGGSQEVGVVSFLGRSTAGQSTITANAGSIVLFEQFTTAADATLICAGGTAYFEGLSDGGQAQVRLSDGGLIEVSGHAKVPMSFGSLAGQGTVSLATSALRIGSNGLNTDFAGVVEEADKPRFAVLTKVGTGTLTFSGANTYTGGTVVEAGTLLVKTKRDSATGTGPVQVNAGAFGGRSNIAGAVTIGSGSGPGATLAPGINGPGVLSIHNTLTFQADGSYDWEVNLAKSQGDEVICKGATIASGAQFTIEPRGNQALPAGTVFTVIENKTHQLISGTFANLPEGAILSVGGNQLQASYRGGDGNDLTLTVLP